MISRLAPIALILTLLSACAGLAPRPATVDLQILALNDFHGNLETPGAAPGQPRTGGAAHLASLIKQRRAPQNSIMVAAGDLVGGHQFQTPGGEVRDAAVYQQRLDRRCDL